MSLSRNPAVFVALAAAIIQFVGDFVSPLTVDQVGVLNATVVAIAGIVTAIWVKHDGLVAALTGFAQSVIALAVAFGWGADASQQASIMALVTTAIGLWVHTQVTAPVDAHGARR